ncbi:MAG: type II secretion system protein GspG [Gammaproteobacteria bacterium]|jgi:general secretion pathway protein G|nr:type II secretion system protein GspG [Gammaproteobacteria bacterium]|tara:strand:- start:447 stop:884 length:438 start_codon:yes stop_codon:yes gene_type:complete
MQSEKIQKGFTLIELMVVLVILGLLAGLVGPQFFGKVDSSKVKTGQIQVDMLKMALKTYRLDMGEYPESLSALWSRPADGSGFWDGPYMDDRVPLDPWGRDYQYRVDTRAEQGFYLYSFGADGAPGGEGLDADIGYFPDRGSAGS